MELSVISSLGTGVAIALLTVQGECSQTRQVDNHDTFTATIVRSPAVRLNSPIRLTRDDGRVFEYRVDTLTNNEDGVTTRLEASGPWLSIAKAGLIRGVLEGVPLFTFSAEAPISLLLGAYFLPNLAADGLDWIDSTLGPIEDDKLCRVEFTEWNRAQLLQSVIDQTNYEPYLWQPSAGARHQLCFAVRRGSDALRYTVAKPLNLIRHSSVLDKTAILTALTPFGDKAGGETDRATVAENSWELSVVDGEWLSLFDPAGAVEAIAFDGQFNDGYCLEVATSTTPVRYPILATRLSDQGVKIADTTGLNVAGLTARIVLNADGDPMVTLRNPAGVFTYGYVHNREEVSGGRGERNWVRNGAFTSGASGWNQSGGGANFIEAHDADDVADHIGLINGTVAPSSTSIAIDGCTPNLAVHKYDILTVEGTELCTAPLGNGHTIKSDGKCTITGVSPLAYALTNNQTLVMRSGASHLANVTVDGAHLAGATTLNLKSFATVTRQLTNGDKILFEAGGTYTARTADRYGFANSSGAPVAYIAGIPLMPGAFGGTLNSPAATDISAGDAVVFRTGAGDTLNAVVTADYIYGGERLYVNITIPPGTPVMQDYFTIEIVKYAQQLVTLTNSSVEFSEGGTATGTWSGGLPTSFVTGRAKWMNSSSVFLAYLDIASGAGNAATSALLSFSGRSRVQAGVSFDGGSINETLYVASAVTLNGAGAGTISLAGVNSATLTDNARVRILRNEHGWTTDIPLDRLLRVSAAAISDSFPVINRGTTPRNVWVTVEGEIFVPIGTNIFSSKGGGLANKCQMTLEAAVTGLGTYTTSTNIDVPATWASTARPAPQPFSIQRDFMLDQSRMMTVKISSTDASQLLVWLMIKTVRVVITDDQGTPFTHTFHGKRLWQLANRRLLVADAVSPPVTGAIIDLSQIRGAQLVPQTIELGQDVTLEMVNDTQRAFRISCDPRDLRTLEVGFERERPFFEELVA